jgi:hypothetical protein
MAEIQEVRQRPAEFIEALGKTYADELTKTVGGLKEIDVSKLYGPQFVAGPGALTTQAEQMAGGLGAYQPYLKQQKLQQDLQLIKLTCLHISKMLLLKLKRI